MLRIEDHLRLSITVPHIDEYHPPEVPPDVHPAIERDDCSDVGGPKLAARMCPFCKKRHVNSSGVVRIHS
jgi:hypothetical protein